MFLLLAQRVTTGMEKQKLEFEDYCLLSFSFLRKRGYLNSMIPFPLHLKKTGFVCLIGCLVKQSETLVVIIFCYLNSLSCQMIALVISLSFVGIKGIFMLIMF